MTALSSGRFRNESLSNRFLRIRYVREGGLCNYKPKCFGTHVRDELMRILQLERETLLTNYYVRYRSEKKWNALSAEGKTILNFLSSCDRETDCYAIVSMRSRRTNL